MIQSANRKQDRINSDPDPLSSADDREEWIGRQLREVYNKTLDEPIPERFLELLEQIDKKDPESK